MVVVRGPIGLGAAQMHPEAQAALLAKGTAGMCSCPILSELAPGKTMPACNNAGRRVLLGFSFASLGEIISLYCPKGGDTLQANPTL